MRHGLIQLALGLGVSASASQKRWHECKFELNAKGGANGCIGQLEDGQCRIGSKFPATTFVLDQSSGTLRDSRGRSCVITSWAPHQQIQCDEGKSGSPGWSIENGELRHSGCGDFAACPVNDFGEWNIYKFPIKNELKCVGIHLKASCSSAPAPPQWSPPNSEQPKLRPRPCCHECPEEKHSSCHKLCDKKCKPSPKPKPCCHECPKEPEHKCHKSCDTKCNPARNPQDHHHEGIHPKVGQCLKWCDEDDWECKKTCHGVISMPPAYPSHPEHYSSPAEECKPCEKCKHEDRACLKDCSENCNWPEPRPCAQCKPWNFKCKQGCIPEKLSSKPHDGSGLWSLGWKRDWVPVMDSHPGQKCCNKCAVISSGELACHKTCDSGCNKRRSVETTIACESCPREDNDCKIKCHGPKPPPCHSCNKKPDCEKKCWHHFPSKPAPCCTKCEHWDKECFKVCTPPKHKPHYHKAAPVCCAECADWDKDCFKTCFPPDKFEGKLEWSPEAKHNSLSSYNPRPCHKCHLQKPECHKSCKPSPCHKCHPDHHECKKTCWKAESKPHWEENRKPGPCHKCHPEKPSCHKSCKPSPCHKCKPKHEECRKTCKKPEKFEPPYDGFKPWPKPEGKPWPKPFPKCCDHCQKHEHACKDSCISREVLERFVTGWQELMPKEAVEGMTNDEMFEKIADQLDAAIEPDEEAQPQASENLDATDASAASKSSEIRSTEGSEAKDAETKSSEAEDSEQKDSEPKAEETGDGNAKEKVVENTHQPARRAEASKQCRCADGDRECIERCVTVEVEKEIVICKDCREKKGCDEAKKCEPIKPKPCHVCHKEKEEDSCKKTCYSKLTPPFPCHKCHPKDKDCKHSCQSPEPHNKKSCPCWDCPKGDWECLKHCFIPEHHKHTPFCCNDCHKENKSCHQKCHKECKPHHPKPPSCWDCKKDDSKCHKHCSIPDGPKHKPFCCHDCHKENKSCHKKCDKKCKPLVPKPRPCWECEKGDFECLKHCFYPEESKHEKSKCCHECPNEPEHKCHKTCDKKCKPIPAPEKPRCCHECPKEPEHKCHKSCDKKCKPPHHGPPSEEECVKRCHKDDWECKKACYFPWTPDHPQGPPLHEHEWPHPPPTEPKCCDECPTHDKECHKTCWEKPRHSVPCEECPYKDFKCLEHCHLKPKHDRPDQHHHHPHSPPVPAPKPHCNETKPPQHPHAPPPTWGAPSSGGKVPGQLFGACPANINGDHQFPASIIPISTSEPNKAYGNSNAYIDDRVSSIFNFELPASYSGKTCSLFFYWPHEKTDTCTFSGHGYASFDLVGKAEQSTTCAVRPQVYRHLNDIPMKPGTTYWVADHPCTPGSVSFEISGKQGFALTFAQHQAIGLFVRAC